MKIYIVVTKDYEYDDEYSIDKVFTDRQKAEEYSNWLEIDNRIREFYTEDKLKLEKYQYVAVKAEYSYLTNEINIDISYKENLKNKYWSKQYQTNFTEEGINLETIVRFEDNNDDNAQVIALIKEDIYNTLMNIIQDQTK